MQHHYATLRSEQLIPADRNPQKMAPATFKALRAAIAEDDGLLDDPVVWKTPQGYRIISGHHRIKALVHEGKLVNCKVIEDPKADEVWYRRRVLSANRVHGEPDDEMLRNFLLQTFEVTGVKSADFFQDLGFTAQEVMAYMAQTDEYDLSRAGHEADEREEAAKEAAGQLPPATIKQVSIFIPIGDYPEFMRRAAELMRMRKMTSVTDVVVAAVNDSYEKCEAKAAKKKAAAQ